MFKFISYEIGFKPTAFQLDEGESVYVVPDDKVFTKGRQNDIIEIGGGGGDSGGGGGSGGEVPIGSIVSYGGLFIDIPENWSLCDGTNLTPDLTDSFLMGTIDELTIGEVGGSKAATMPLHSHSIDHNHDSFNSSSDGDHTHSYENYPAYPGYVSAGSGYSINDSSPHGETTGGDGEHDHSINVPDYSGDSSMEGSESPTTANLPPYYKVAYIMRMY